MPVVIDSETSQSNSYRPTPVGTQRPNSALLRCGFSKETAGSRWTPRWWLEADGRIAPDAAALDVSFSRGGADPLVVVREGGTSLTWRWPGDLPAPVVTGDTAVYQEVLPGVDLQVRAGVESFSEVLVVRDQEAAGDPRLAQLTLQSDVEGGELSRRDGGLVVTNMAGEVVLNSNPALMWDASGAKEPGLHRLREDSAAIADAGFSADGPVEGDHVEALDVALVDGHLRIAVDQSMLSDPDTTFPVVIDPELSAVRNSWAMVNQTFASQEYYNWSDASEGVGYVTGGSYGTHTKRLFWDFDTFPLLGKNIIKATFSATQTHAYDCTANAVSSGAPGRRQQPRTGATSQPGSISSPATPPSTGAPAALPAAACWSSPPLLPCSGPPATARPICLLACGPPRRRRARAGAVSRTPPPLRWTLTPPRPPSCRRPGSERNPQDPVRDRFRLSLGEQQVDDAAGDRS